MTRFPQSLSFSSLLEELREALLAGCKLAWDPYLENIGLLEEKNATNIFPVPTERASSITFLLSWIYFEFPDGTAPLIGETRAIL